MSDGHTSNRYDLVVVGGGIFGLSTAWEAGRRGRRTLVVERGRIPNSRAASYGPSRKMRSAYRDAHYARLAREAVAAWREIEAQVGRELYVAAGNLYYTNLDEQPELDARERGAGEAGSQICVLDERDLRARYPQLKRARRGILETDAGFLRASVCVEALHALALRHGVDVVTEREVTAVEPSGSGLSVRVGADTFQATQVVLAGGGWSARLFPELAGPLWQCQQGLMYVHGLPEIFSAPACVPFACLDNNYYGFPSEPGVGMKIAQHVLGDPITDPDFDRATLPTGFVEGAERFLREDLGVRLADYRATYDSCMYNLSRSNDFLLDFHPDLPGLFFATAGSGHGFKFGPIIGGIVLDRLDGVTGDRWIPHFSYASFASAAHAPRPL